MTLPINQIVCGDNVTVMKEWPDNCIDSVVTDPPYGLSFMGKRWDYDVPSIETWQEVLRVMKPGAHALVACGTRTQHRMAVNLEDAGFEIRDIVMWVYGSGFPKSLDISKAIDKELGCEREVVRIRTDGVRNTGRSIHKQCGLASSRTKTFSVTAPASPQALQYSGWGTALKPAVELFTLCRKPISEKNIARNVLKYGTGGLNIDGCRVGVERRVWGGMSTKKPVTGVFRDDNWEPKEITNSAIGRFPANLIHDGSDEVVGLFPITTGGKAREAMSPTTHDAPAKFGYSDKRHQFSLGDSGSAARFFYCAKASPSERGDGNTHPTVKPIALMQYLVRLITPPGGVVLDPFAGSGSTLVAAVREGFAYIGIELNADYHEIATKRVSEETEQTKLFNNKPNDKMFNGTLFEEEVK